MKQSAQALGSASAQRWLPTSIPCARGRLLSGAMFILARFLISKDI